MLSVSDVAVVITSTQVTQVPPNHFGCTLEVVQDPGPGTLEVIGFYSVYPDTQAFSDFCLIGSPSSTHHQKPLTCQAMLMLMYLMLCMLLFIVCSVLSPLTICSINTVLHLFGGSEVPCHLWGVSGLDTHSPFVLELSRGGQPWAE